MELASVSLVADRMGEGSRPERPSEACASGGRLSHDR
jgi:hypothetical protein